MKKVLTAIGNSMLNHKIRKMEDYEVLTEDIATGEALLEILEQEEIVEILFLCRAVIQHYEISEFISLVRKIHENIFIVLFNEDDMDETVKEDEKLKLYSSTDLDFKALERDFQKKNITNIRKYTSKVIAISGGNGVGKSTFSTFLAKNVENFDKKVLLIDFDIEENHVKTILKRKETIQFTENIRDGIVNIHKNIDVLYDLKSIFPDKEQINFFIVQKMIAEFKEEYNLIIIDTSSNLENEYTKRVFYNSDKIIFLLEPNILGIKKAKNMLEVFENDWRISKEKVSIILNKTNLYGISESVIAELFLGMKIIGKMKYQEFYHLMINKDINKKEITKEYRKILAIL